MIETVQAIFAAYKMTW